jgi:hypothetical protein
LEKNAPLSDGLRQLVIDAVERAWQNEPWESGPETVHLLNCLKADMDDLDEDDRVDLLSCAVRGPGGLELSLHYWGLLDQLVVVKGYHHTLESGDSDVTRALREAEDWEKLEIWMLVMWKSVLGRYSTPESVEDIEQVTLDLLSRRPSVLQRFESICGVESSYSPNLVLRDICKRARIENPPSEDSPGLPYVSLRSAGTCLF